ncbi:MAG: DUF4230 domain-containing protein [Flavobacteriales bacterium]
MLTFQTMQVNNKLLLPILALLTGIFLTYAYFSVEKKDSGVSEHSQVIQNEIKNLSKLIVVEGSYSNVYSYKDINRYFGDWISFEKKVLVVVNAKAQVMYDMKQLDLELDSTTQTIFLNKIPQPEVQIVPDIKYYDIQQSTFNQFSSEEMNKVKSKAVKEIENMVELSDLKKQAEKRLEEELCNIFILSKSLGWQIKNNTTYSFEN